MDEKELQEYLHNMGQKERRELTARLRLVKPKRKKAYIQSILEQQRLQLEAELTTRGLKVVHLRLICFCVAAAFHPVPVYVFFTVTRGCRKMTNGVNGTKAAV